MPILTYILIGICLLGGFLSFLGFTSLEFIPVLLILTVMGILLKLFLI